MDREKLLIELVNKRLTKDEIYKKAEEIGGEFIAKKMTKEQLLKTLIEKIGYDKVCQAFLKYAYVPCWKVAEHYKLNTDEIDRLAALGVIKEQPVIEPYWSKGYKGYLDATTYPPQVMELYNADELKKAYNEAYGGNTYRVRIGAETKEELNGICEEMDKVFEVSSKDFYPKREHGYHLYFDIKPLNGGELEKARYRVALEDKDEEIQKLKNEHLEDKKSLVAKIGHFFGLYIQAGLEELRDTAFAIRTENERLKKEIELLIKQSKETKKNSRNAGRKARFGEQEIATMEMYQVQGKSMREIADMYNCSVATVHKLIGKHNQNEK